MDLEKFLSNSYNTQNFEQFISEKFYGFEPLDTQVEDEELSESEKHHIKNYRFLGQVELDDGSEIGFFEFASASSNIENKRVVFSNVLKKLAKEYLLDGAIASFYHPKSDAWRLSFVGFEYDEGKANVTNLKRYTYVLGESIPHKTALQQLKKIKYPKYEEIEEAFSVEAVSKDFFKQYRALYEEIFKNDSLKIQIIDEKEREIFSKNLLGRIVFLYFLQKKRWLGVNKDAGWGTGSKRFMSKLYNSFKDGNFYLDTLYPLFFDALNKNRATQNDYFEPLQCRIPFLNGGLFDADEIDKKSKNIILDNSIFEKIFQLFDSYNFTIIEDIPHDSEVAVDPEMLGRIFENLLDENYRKGHGAFYTPREIVHYMCQNSLVKYLANDFDANEIKLLVLEQITDRDYIRHHASEIETKLKKVKVLDPAIGSGAFPMGLLHELISVLINLNKSLNTSSNLYNIKKELIENCIHGVDIDESAVDIAKLRFWLSLIVDADEPEPLPNLYFKIMHGNSLVETVDGIDPIPADISEPKTKKAQKQLFGKVHQAWDFDKIDAQDHILILTKKLHQFFKTNEKQKKESLLKEIFSAIKAILEQKIDELTREVTNLKEKAATEELKTKTPAVERKIKSIWNKITKNEEIIAKIKELQKHPISRAIFMYKLWFGETLKDKDGGFDIVIANPPYIKEYTDKSAFDGTRGLSCYQGKMDIWYLFACLGIDLLKDEQGVLTYIATNNWISNAGASDFRNKVLRETKILEFIDFGDYKVFDSAGIQTMIMMLKKTTDNAEYFTEYSKVIDKNISKAELEKFLQKEKSDKFEIFEAKIIKKDLIDDNITFLRQNIFSILSILESNRNFELEDKEVAQGIVGSPDKAFIVKEEDYDNFNDEEKVYLKRFYTNAGKYLANSTDKYIFYMTNKNFKDKNISDLININSHFKKYEQELIQAKIRYKTPNKPYFYLHREREEIFFKIGAKIICATRTISPSCTYTEDEFYGSRALNFIKTDRINLKYLTAILNSTVTHYWLKYMGKLTGDLLQIDKSQLLSIPIKKIKNTQSFELIVDYIILLKKEDSEKYKFEIEFFEKLIDIMVYELYFTKELQSEGYGVIAHIEKEAVENASLEQVLKLYAFWSDRNHKIAYNVAFIDSLELIKTIESNI